MKRNITILLTISVLILGGCKSKDNTDAVAGQQKMTIRTQEVHTQEVEQTYEYTAIVEANAVNNIAPLTGGRIDKIYVEVGDRVGKGKVLVQMNENSLKQAKVQLDNLKAHCCSPWQFLEIRTQTLLQVVLGPSSEEHAMVH